MISRTIYQYHITEKLGGGGMGVVYKAEDTRLDRSVALKFLPPHLSRDPEANERFTREAKAASALDHPNICTIYDIGEDDEGQLFIVMAYYEGQTLKYRLADGLSIDESVEIAIQIAEGLARAHEAGIVHRYVKPANIMVTDPGRVKILDFGVAKLGGSVAFTKAGSTLGTVAYMSPEQTRGEEVDQRTDLWALGVVLYEMLAGERPFRGDYDQAVVYSILNEDPAPIKDLNAEVPEGLAQVVEKLLAKDPSERYQRVEDLLPDLKVFRRADIQTASVESMDSAPEVVSMWRWVMIAVSAVLVFLGGLWMLSRLDSDSDESATPVARTAIAVLPFSVGGDEDLTYLNVGMVDLLSTVLDGAGELRSIDPNALLGFIGNDPEEIRDPQRGREIAAHFGAGSYVQGTVLKVGDLIRVSATLYDEQTEVLAKAEAEAADENELWGAIDDLARQLIAGQLRGAEQRQASLAALTTKSLPALKAYLQGEQALRDARRGATLEAFQQAVDADSTFALAWLRLCIALEWNLGADDFWERYFEAHEQALRHSQALPDRDQRLILARDKRWKGEWEEAERVLRSITNEYPDDVSAWRDLGELIFHGGPAHGRLRTEARHSFEQAFAHDPRNPDAIFHLIEISLKERRLEATDSLLARYLDTEDEGYKTAFAALRGLAEAGKDQQEAIFADLVEAGSWVIRRTALDAIRLLDDISLAERLARLLIDNADSPGWQWEGHYLLATLAVARGRWEAAKEQIASLEQIDSHYAVGFQAEMAVLPFLPVSPSERETLRTRLLERAPPTAPPYHPMAGKHHAVTWYLAALLSLQRDDDEGLRDYAGRLRNQALIEGDSTLADGLAKSLGAFVAWRDGQSAAALSALIEITLPEYTNWEGHFFYGQHLDRYLRAEILYQEGCLEEALRWYASLAEVSEFLLGPSYLRRAEIYEQLGDTENAITYYTRFLDLWQDADAELQPQVAQARQCLDRLLGDTVREPDDVARPH